MRALFLSVMDERDFHCGAIVLHSPFFSPSPDIPSFLLHYPVCLPLSPHLPLPVISGICPLLVIRRLPPFVIPHVMRDPAKSKGCVPYIRGKLDPRSKSGMTEICFKEIRFSNYHFNFYAIYDIKIIKLFLFRLKVVSWYEYQ